MASKSRRERDRKKQKVEKAQRRATPAKPSSYIHHFRVLLMQFPGLIVVVYCRVSDRKRMRNGNLDRQMDYILLELRKLGVKVIAVFDEANSAGDAEQLEPAAKYALDHGAVLLAFSTDRLLRSEAYSKHSQGVQPTLGEFDNFRKLTGGVTVATLLHPDTPWKEARGRQIKLGMYSEETRGGRPAKLTTPPAGHKAERRKRSLPKVLWMLRTGFSLRDVANALDIPRPTVQGWVKKLRTP